MNQAKAHDDPTASRKESRTNTKKNPERHHYVSQLYLRRFAGGNGKQIVMFERARPHRRIVSPKDTAVQRHFYTLVSSGGAPSFAVEKELGDLETRVGVVFNRIDRGISPASDPDRATLAEFVALMLTRTPEFRDLLNVFPSVEASVTVGISSESIQKRLNEVYGREATAAEIERAALICRDVMAVRPSKDAAIALALTIARESFAPVIAAMHWQIVTTETISFLTSDHPVGLWRDPSSDLSLPSLGLETAEEIYVPLGPRQLLVLTHAHEERGPFVVTADAIGRVNTELVRAAFEAIYCHPEQYEPLAGIQFDAERPLLRVNLAPIYRNNRGIKEADAGVSRSVLQSGPRRSTFAMISAGHGKGHSGAGEYGNRAVSREYDHLAATFKSWPYRHETDQTPFKIISATNAIIYYFGRGPSYWSVVYHADSDTWDEESKISDEELTRVMDL